MVRIIKTCSVNLYEDVLESLKERNINVSEYIRGLLDKETETIEQKKEKISNMKKEVAILETEINNYQGRKIEEATDRELSCIYHSIRLIQKNATYFEPRRKKYNNNFGKNLNSQAFKSLLSNTIIPDRIKNKQEVEYD